MSDPQALVCLSALEALCDYALYKSTFTLHYITLHVTRNVIPGKLGVDLHLHRVHIPLVIIIFNAHLLGRLPKVDLIILEGKNVRPSVRPSVRPQKVSSI